jgi:hypothetical protein
MTYKKSRLFSLVVMTAISAVPQSLTSVKVCDLFGDLEKWNGTFIRATGDIETGQEGGPWLSGRGCSSRIEVKGIVFPNIIQLANPKTPVGLAHHVGFEWDERNRGEFWGSLERADPKSEHVHGTIVGLFETRSPITDLVKFTTVHPEGLLLGFGPGGPAPAQLIVKSITGLSIEKNKVITEERNRPK